MENCFVKTLNVNVDNSNIPYDGEFIRLHANISSSYSGIELSISAPGKEVSIIIDNPNLHLRRQGADLPNPYVSSELENTGFGLPNGEYNIIIIDTHYAINMINVSHPNVSIVNMDDMIYRDMNIVEMRNGKTSSLSLMKLLKNFPNITQFIWVNGGFETQDLSAAYTNSKLTMLNLDNNNNVKGNAESLYEHHAEYSERTCTYIYGTGVKFHNAEIPTRHVVSYDGQGGCVVKNGSNVTLGSYDGTSWTYA